MTVAARRLSRADRRVQRPASRRPVLALDGVDHGDPFVLRHADRFFLYHTGGSAVPVYESVDLRTWTASGIALDSAGAPTWAACDYWAPEVICRDGTFYMYVAATSRHPDGRPDDDARRVGVARATDPLGPFTWDPDPLIAHWSIDAHPFRDRDGTWWLFYSARNDATRYGGRTVGCGIAVDRLLAPDRVADDATVVLVPDHRWEGNRRATWFWNEGPAVRWHDDRYWMLYSGGFYGDRTYAVGLATAAHPRGPWTKHPDNPLLVSGRDVLGPGHVCFTDTDDGQRTLVVHHGYVPRRRGRAVFIGVVTWRGDRVDVEPFA